MIKKLGKYHYFHFMIMHIFCLILLLSIANNVKTRCLSEFSCFDSAADDEIETNFGFNSEGNGNSEIRVDTDNILANDIMQLWPRERNSLTASAMRNALKRDSNQRWIDYKDNDGNYIVPYAISREFSPHQQRQIQSSLAQMERHICIKFRAHQSESDFVYFVPTTGIRGSCYTMVGKCVEPYRDGCIPNGAQGGYKNLIVLPPSIGCVEHRVIVHETLHKLGLWHEQMRYDRDQHITVLYDRIDPEMHTQFTKIGAYQSEFYGVPYDYRSVMHYPSTAGAIVRGTTTIRTRDPQYQNVIGQAMDASEGDYQKICGIYECEQCGGRSTRRRRPTTTPPPLPSPPPIGGSEENGGDDDGDDDGNGGGGGEDSSQCAHCQPFISCSRNDAIFFKYFFMEFCCGNCGRQWRKQWCGKQRGARRAHWIRQGMCTAQH